MEINHTVNDQSYLFTISYWFSTSDDFNYLRNVENYPLISYSLTTNDMSAINDAYIEEWVKDEMQFKELTYDKFYKSDKVRKDNGLTWYFTIYHKEHNKPIGR